MVDRCWLGETNFDFRFSEASPPNATAIEINGNDHYVLNTVVFSSKIGLAVNGGANYVTGTHVWFPLNRALAFDDVMAFHITQSQNRFNGCYIDGSRAVFEGGALQDNVWTHGFECCAGSGLGDRPHGIILKGSKVGPGLQITHSIFRGGSISTEASANEADLVISGMRIEDNFYAGGVGKASRATKTLTQKSATSWLFDFCDVLLWPTIARVEILGVQAAAGFPTAVARPPSGCKVTVETSEPVTGTLTVRVDAAALSDSFL